MKKSLQTVCRTLIIAALCLTACSSWAQYATVTANFTNITGSNGSGAYLHFDLQNCGANFPIITDNGAGIAQTTYDFHPDSVSGLISGQVVGNDHISCAGQTGTTFYMVSVLKDVNQPIAPGPICYVINSGASWTLGSSTCTNPPPAPLIGTGCSYSAYGQITCLGTPGFVAPVGFDGGYYDCTSVSSAPPNPANGNYRIYCNSTTGLLSCITSSGTSCMPSGSSGIGTSSVGCNTVYNTTTTVSGECVILDASQFSGADACAKIAAAFAALPVAGGIVDARNLTGSQTCASNPYASFTGAATLLLGPASYTISASWTPPSGNQIIAFNYNTASIGAAATTLTESNTFPNSTPMISAGTSEAGVELRGIQLVCNNQSNSNTSTGFSANTLENFVVDRVITYTCYSSGIALTSSAYGKLSNLYLYTGGNTSATGISLSSSADGYNPISIDMAFCAGSGTICLSIAGGGGYTVSSLIGSGSGENGVTISSTGTDSSTFSEIYGTTTAVSVASASGNRGLNFFGLYATGTNILVDSVTSHSLVRATCPYVAYYQIGDTTSPSINTSCPITWTVGGLPTASQANGKSYTVTDSTTVSSEGQTCVGGSSNNAIAISNGSTWKCF